MCSSRLLDMLPPVQLIEAVFLILNICGIMKLTTVTAPFLVNTLNWGEMDLV